MEKIRQILSVDFDNSDLFTFEFSTVSDGDEFYRTQEILMEQFQYYYPEVVSLKKWRTEIDDENIIYMLERFYEDGNKFPPQELL
jgi:hypothetical protein